MKSELVPANGDPPIPITRDLTVIGRREFCDVQIDHESLSKRHCVLVRTDGLLMVRDLASTNGTRVNGQKVMWAALLPNDRLTLGRYKVKVYLGPDDVPGPSEGGQPMIAEPARTTPRGGAKAGGGFSPPTPIGGYPQATPGRELIEDEEVLDGNVLLLDDDEQDDVIELD